MREVVIVDGVRSAFTNFGGGLRTLASVDIASAMIAGGAADYLLKPCPTEELEGAIRAVYDRRQATRPR